MPMGYIAATDNKSCSKLTDRELEVLSLMAEGKSNIEIAEKLIISTHTAKAHVGHIISKMHAKDRVHAVAKAIRKGII